MNDSSDRLALTSEALERKDDPEVDAVLDEADDQWEAFVAAHGELAAPPTLTDEEIFGGLRAAIENRPKPWLLGAAASSDVVRVLLPDAETCANNCATPIVLRTGKHLARLAREGRVVRLRQKWTKGRGKSMWSLPGVEVNEWWLKQYEVEDG